MNERRCVVCGKSLNVPAKGGRRLYCSPRCKRKADTARRRQALVADVIKALDNAEVERLQP